MEEDLYHTIQADTEAVFKDRSSKFLAYAFAVRTETEIKERLDELRKRYYDATHHCYAWRLGADGNRTRANDDGEPPGTAGKPILSQLLSYDLTDILVVVVRYFGGTKLGVPGLINAYRESTRAVLDHAQIIEKTVDAVYTMTFAYVAMNGAMKLVKELLPRIISQDFDNVCRMTVAVRKGQEQEFLSKAEKTEGVVAEFERYE